MNQHRTIFSPFRRARRRLNSLTELDRNVGLTKALLRAKRLSRRRPRFRHSGADELSRSTFFERLFHVLLTPTRLFRRNKKRSHLLRRSKRQNPLRDFSTPPEEIGRADAR